MEGHFLKFTPMQPNKDRFLSRALGFQNKTSHDSNYIIGPFLFEDKITTDNTLDYRNAGGRVITIRKVNNVNSFPSRKA